MRMGQSHHTDWDGIFLLGGHRHCQKMEGKREKEKLMHRLNINGLVIFFNVAAWAAIPDFYGNEPKIKIKTADINFPDQIRTGILNKLPDIFKKKA